MNELEKLEEAQDRLTRLYLIEARGEDRSEVKAGLTFISTVITDQSERYINIMLSKKTAA